MTTSSGHISVTRDTQTRALEPPRPPHSLMRILMNPWADKIIAIIAILPFIGPIIVLFQDIGFNIPAISYIIQATILVATMVVRRTPVRITSNPLFWLLAFVASYWGFLIMAVENHGGRLAPSWLTDTLAIAGIVMMLWARLSLGRNIGFVPAQREIVTRGAYKYMRHPIYTAAFLSIIGAALDNYTVRNVTLFALAIVWFLIKSLVEENFLRKDPAYAAYMGRVRWRWLPGLL